MEAVGIDVTAGAARAAAIDASGDVLRASVHEASDGATALQAATLAAKVSAATPLGIATDDPALAGAAALGKLSSGGAPPVVCRAGDALAIAESWVGAARGARHAVCLWLGDRVLAGVLMNGEPWRGAHGLA